MVTALPCFAIKTQIDRDAQSWHSLVQGMLHRFVRGRCVGALWKDEHLVSLTLHPKTTFELPPFTLP